MPRYFREVEATEDGFAEPVQFVGVYALRWRDHPEQPSIAFVESDLVDDLLAACEADEAAHRHYHECPACDEIWCPIMDSLYQNARLLHQSAIAKAKGKQ